MQSYEGNVGERELAYDASCMLSIKFGGKSIKLELELNSFGESLRDNV